MENNNKKPAPMVALQKCPDYDAGSVKSALGGLLAGIGGLRRMVQDRDVLLKPNFLVARAAERAVCTHPQVIAEVAAAALAAGASRVSVADSPSLGKARRVAAKLGLLDLLRPLGVEVVDLTEEVEIPRPGSRFPRLLLARRVVEAGAVINLAKLKTHGLCGMTMAVKNCFGAVVGLGKAQWHLRAGRDVESFSAMLVEVCRAVAPVLSIVDAIDSMDGNGPSNGRVRRTGFLAASEDPFVLDRMLAKICRVPDQSVSTFGPDGSPDLAGVRLVGQRPEDLTVEGWQSHRPPQKRRAQLFRGRLVPTPRFLMKKCNLCQQCLKICPQGALSVKKGRIKLDDKSCIRCFCCQEVCPEGAVIIRRGWLH